MTQYQMHRPGEIPDTSWTCPYCGKVVPLGVYHQCGSATDRVVFARTATDSTTADLLREILLTVRLCLRFLSVGSHIRPCPYCAVPAGISHKEDCPFIRLNEIIGL